MYIPFFDNCVANRSPSDRAARCAFCIAWVLDTETAIQYLAHYATIFVLRMAFIYEIDADCYHIFPFDIHRYNPPHPRISQPNATRSAVLLRPWA
jgi:hypothetical protein